MEASTKGCIGFVFTFLIALGFIGWGIWDVIDAQACTEPVRGVIERQVSGGRNASIEVRHEVAGQTFRATVSRSGQPGQPVNLLFEPQHVDHVRKAGLAKGWFFMGAAVLLVMCAAIGAVWRSIRGRG